MITATRNSPAGRTKSSLADKKKSMQRKRISDLSRPVVCAPIVGANTEDDILQIRSAEDVGADALEFRIDALAKPTKAAVELIVMSSKLPMILVNRCLGDNGKFVGTEKEKMGLFMAALESGANTFDVEYGHLGQQHWRSFVELLHKRGCEVFFSYHSYEKPLSRREIVETAVSMQTNGASVAKVVSVANTREDVLETVLATQDLQATLRIPFIALSMGNIGRVSRVLCLEFGSHLAFCSLRENMSSAPGQYTIEQYAYMRSNVAGLSERLPLRDLLEKAYRLDEGI